MKRNLSALKLRETLFFLHLNFFEVKLKNQIEKICFILSDMYNVAWPTISFCPHEPSFSLLIISKFVLDEMFQRNASKFAIFYKDIWKLKYMKIWQILKRFAGTFCRAQTLKLWGVFSFSFFLCFLWGVIITARSKISQTPKLSWSIRPHYNSVISLLKNFNSKKKSSSHFSMWYRWLELKKRQYRKNFCTTYFLVI